MRPRLCPKCKSDYGDRLPQTGKNALLSYRCPKCGHVWQIEEFKVEIPPPFKPPGE